MKTKLTNSEKQAIKTLNFIAKFDGIITNIEDIHYLLQKGIEEFIPKRRRDCLTIKTDNYPIKITINQTNLQTNKEK